MTGWFSKATLAAAAWLAACMLPGAAAQQTGPTDAQIYTALDTWLRADEYNARCRQLNYFEVEEIARRINDVKDLTPEGKEMVGAIGQPGFDAKLEVVREMLETRRKTAREAVASRACNESDADLSDARGTYLKNFLKAIIAAQNAPAKASDSQARRDAMTELTNFIIRLYGTNYNTVGQQLVAELQAEGFDPDTAWRVLEVPLDDSIWQLNMKSKGFDYHPYYGALGYYKAVRTNGTGDFPAKLTKRTLFDVRDEVGTKLKVSKADGLMDDGRLVVLVNKQGKYPGLALQAELLVQESAEDYGKWSAEDWRSRTLRFTPEVMAAADCPVDFCFVFPVEAAETIRTRQAAEDSFKYRYELFVGEAARFPLSENAYPFQRTEYHPPYLVEKDDASDGGE